MSDRQVYRGESLRYRYPEAADVAVRDVDLDVGENLLYGIIGPNGSGKSTLLRLLLGGLTPARGRIRFRDRLLEDWGRRELATRVGAVPQHEEVAFPLTVREFVALGRYPHLGPWRAEGAEDRDAILHAMERCQVADLAGRAFSTLSGGERQLVRIARALAQQPEVLVLDEPTVSLDVRHEMEIFELIRDLVDQQGVTVVLVTHNLNAAGRFADRLLLLENGRPAAEGPPKTVLRREVVERVYGWPVRVVPHPGPGPDAGAPQIVPLAGNGPAPDRRTISPRDRKRSRNWTRDLEQEDRENA